MFPLRLSNGDRLTVKSTPDHIQMAIYAYEHSWRDWETAGLQQEAHETCCAWWQLRPIRPAISMEIETLGTHRIVLRGPPNSVVKVELKRSRFEAAVCDPVICDAVRANACRLGVFERPSILEVRVTEDSENDYDSLRMWIACEYKGWAIGLFASVIPSISFAVICIIVRCRPCRGFSEATRDAASPIYNYPGLQAASPVGGVKQGVDFV